MPFLKMSYLKIKQKDIQYISQNTGFENTKANQPYLPSTYKQQET